MVAAPVVAAPVVAAPVVAATDAVKFVVTSDWGSGFNGDVTIKNITTAAMANWTVTFNFDGQISSLWNGVLVSRSGSLYTVRNESWNGALAVGASATFGFSANPGGAAAVLRNLTLVGTPIAAKATATLAQPLATNEKLLAAYFEEWGIGGLNS